MTRKALLGHKVRRVRRDRQLSQVELARRLGISASYLNLIEHNERPLTLPLLLKIAAHFEIDLQSFSQDGETRLFGELKELFRDPVFKDEPLLLDDLNEVVDLAPSVCNAIVTLYRAYRSARADLDSLSERLSEDSFLSTSTQELRTLLTSIRSFAEILNNHQTIKPAERRRFISILAQESDRLSHVVDHMLEFAVDESSGRANSGATPVDETSDFIQSYENHFSQLEEAAEAMRRDAELDYGVGPARVVDALAERHGLEVRFIGTRPEEATFESGDEQTRQVLLSEADPSQTRRFLIARQIALLACESLFQERLAGQHFSSDISAALCRRELAGYVAGALLMPYQPFLEAAQELRYDIERLQRRFDVSFEQVCHRLTTLQRVGAKGVPFHFVRIDIAGNVSKRFSASGLRIARYGGICPRWNVHSAFLTPSRIRRQVSRMPDGSNYLDIARTVTKGDHGYGQSESLFAVGIGCEIAHAREVVYSDGLDLEQASAVVPIGVTCRLCERHDCRQRASSPILPSLRNEGATPNP